MPETKTITLKQSYKMETVETRLEETRGDHTFRGMSKAGYGAGKIYLEHVHKDHLSKPYGIFRPGKIGHEHFQYTVFPAGKFFPMFRFDSPQGDIVVKNMEIMEHEQLIHFKIHGVRRWSPIDTPVYFRDDDCIWVIDYKFKNDYGFKGLKEDADIKHRAQANLYAWRYAKMSGIPCPKYMIMYVRMSNYTETKCYLYDTNDQFAIECYGNLKLMETLKEKGLVRHKWSDITPCLYNDKWCDKYCDVQNSCLRNFEEEYGRKFETPSDVRRHQFLLKKQRQLEF